MGKILCVNDQGDRPIHGCQFDETDELVEVSNPLEALTLLAEQQFDRVVLFSNRLIDPVLFGRLLENEEILQGMPDGVALLDSSHDILWANHVFADWAAVRSVIGVSFYDALGNPEILGPDFCPFHTAMATSRAAISSVRVGENRYFQVHAAPLRRIPGANSSPRIEVVGAVDNGDSFAAAHTDSFDVAEYLVVTLRDITDETLQQQKLEALHKAGMHLADLMPEEIFEMKIEERIELLKSNILHLMNDLLRFDVMEVRLLDQSSNELSSLLSVGMDEEAANRQLFAEVVKNGVTGFVAATGKSYLCEDTTEDPLYLDGLKDAKSSLTVPLIWHDQVIGTINVESPETNAFSESDLLFLEIFSRDLAAALNTLELLVAQKTNTAQESVEAIHSAVALPIDQILNDAVAVMERYIGHNPDVVKHLQAILKNARDIKQVIHKVGESMAPAEAVPVGVQVDRRPLLRNRRFLVVDDDESVRNDAHTLLDRYGCWVETATDGSQAISLGKASISSGGYDAILTDIRLPDMSGYDLLMKFKEFMNCPPLILMSGFGYDPGHSLVKARQEGLPAYATLYKPFRLDQLIETVEKRVIDNDAIKAQAHDNDQSTPDSQDSA